jgi:integrase
VWVIPSERFKSERQNLVPLSDDACALLETLPRWPAGDLLFTTTQGKKPVGGFSKAKARLDALMAEQLGAPPEKFVVHDVRRTVRTRLSALRVPEVVAEMVMGHAPKGMASVYDQHHYEPEMREALEKWSGLLRTIVEPTPTPDNVIEMRRA